MSAKGRLNALLADRAAGKNVSDLEVIRATNSADQEAMYLQGMRDKADKFVEDTERKFAVQRELAEQRRTEFLQKNERRDNDTIRLLMVKLLAAVMEPTDDAQQEVCRSFEEFVKSEERSNEEKLSILERTKHKLAEMALEFPDMLPTISGLIKVVDKYVEPILMLIEERKSREAAKAKERELERIQENEIYKKEQLAKKEQLERQRQLIAQQLAKFPMVSAWVAKCDACGYEGKVGLSAGAKRPWFLHFLSGVFFIPVLLFIGIPGDGDSIFYKAFKLIIILGLYAFFLAEFIAESAKRFYKKRGMYLHLGSTGDKSIDKMWVGEIKCPRCEAMTAGDWDHATAPQADPVVALHGGGSGVHT
ncbi:hypothetical protein [Inhella gelatinilytica]|uniref:Uncharacterized protein n=1 Tax=Inhella gelatinilytica TaxID=2795030 RepID=A0A931ISI4_9BURK|nr:hypothetical protein [Inhella gelatinilytica]MBH9551887.1 hypothetical protein [Inhella gelatinilytica]